MVSWRLSVFFEQPEDNCITLQVMPGQRWAKFSMIRILTHQTAGRCKLKIIQQQPCRFSPQINVGKLTLDLLCSTGNEEPNFCRIASGG
jgi:hypothetical protein